MKNLKPITDSDIKESRPLLIAGPCSVETREQTLATAKYLAEIGIKIFRGGIWKPRTKPGGFDGVGSVGLSWLREVKEMTDMKVSTEIATPLHLEVAIEAGIDIFWIGARTTANPFAVQELADYIKSHRLDIPLFIKNPVNQDLELWIGALERMYNAGIRRLGAIHRGFSSYRKQLYRNSPEWQIPIELRRRYPHLPLLSDPSHIGGRKYLISPLSQEALDMGFDGLIIESHINPEEALSDKAQQVTPKELKSILDGLIIRNIYQGTENLESLRKEIDRLDDELLEILAKRMAVCREIGEYKLENHMPVVQIDRHSEMMRSRLNSASKMGISDKSIRKILSAIHEESVRQQIEIVSKAKGRE